MKCILVFSVAFGAVTSSMQTILLTFYYMLHKMLRLWQWQSLSVCFQLLFHIMFYASINMHIDLSREWLPKHESAIILLIINPNQNIYGFDITIYIYCWRKMNNMFHDIFHTCQHPGRTSVQSRPHIYGIVTMQTIMWHAWIYASSKWAVWADRDS